MFIFIVVCLCYIYIIFVTLKLFLDTLLGAHAKSGQQTGNILDQRSLSHEQEGRCEDRLDNLGRDALVQTGNTLVLDDLAESIHDRAVALTGIVRLLELHAGLDHTESKTLEKNTKMVSTFALPRSMVKGNLIRSESSNIHVWVGDAGGGQLGNGAEDEEVEAGEGAGLGDSGLDLLKDGVLDDRVGDKDQGGGNTLPEGLEALVLDHLTSSFDGAHGARVGLTSIAGGNAGLFVERRFVDDE